MTWLNALLERRPSLRYAVPFAAFILLVLIFPGAGSGRLESFIRVAALVVVLAVFAGPVLSFKLTRPLGTTVVGVVVFLIWIAPDQFIPGYRQSPWFQNAFTGELASSVSIEARNDHVILALRLVRATILVPILEELFWRGWLGRWIDRPDDFRKVPLGQFSTFAFVATTVLFAVEHGPFWDVGLVAGVIYNWWMIKTKNLGDLVWCHAITNACLSIWVLLMGQWQYW